MIRNTTSPFLENFKGSTPTYLLMGNTMQSRFSTYSLFQHNSRAPSGRVDTAIFCMAHTPSSEVLAPQKRPISFSWTQNLADLRIFVFSKISIIFGLRFRDFPAAKPFLSAGFICLGHWYEVSIKKVGPTKEERTKCEGKRHSQEARSS